MKKTVLFTAALFAFSAVSAQTGEITSNRGENWLSQDGDWGLTFKADPLLNFAGNLFNGHAGNGGVALESPFGSEGAANTYNENAFAIGGKKLIDANTAYRAQIRLGFGSSKSTSLEQQAGQSDPEVTVENSVKDGFMGIDLGFGLEKRVGSTRVVGVYGAMFNVGFGSNKTTYEYGNALTKDHNMGGAARTTEEKGGSTFGLGLNAFAGVEWFCAPKISLSGEYTWGINMKSKGFGSTSSESWNIADDKLETSTTEGPTGKKNDFFIDNGYGNFNVGINFYFQ